MADNSRPVAEPLQKGAQAAQAVRGAVKTGKAIAGAAKGAAADVYKRQAVKHPDRFRPCPQAGSRVHSNRSVDRLR